MTTSPRSDNTIYQTSPRPKLVDAYKRPEENQTLWKTERKTKSAIASYLKKSEIRNTSDKIKDFLFLTNLSKFYLHEAWAGGVGGGGGK